MGGMTGMELHEKLIERQSPLPIVFITGHGDVPMAVESMKKGALDFIQKPFKEDQLVMLVERMLEKAKERSNTAGRQPRALLSKLTGDQMLERIVMTVEQADRRRPGHQHQDGGSAPRQHRKTRCQHRGRPAQDRSADPRKSLNRHTITPTPAPTWRAFPFHPIPTPP
jgi:YesN/AraC family two-component response regulator